MRKASFNMGRFLACIAVLCLPFGNAAFSSVIYVSPAPDGNDGNDGLSWVEAKATVNGAIAAAEQGNQIWVAAGVYQEHIQNRLIDGEAVDVALYGGFAGDETEFEDRDVDENVTILDGTQSGAVVTILGGAGPETRVDGFYITGGLGGIDISNSAPVIAYNTIKDNLDSGIHIYKYKIVRFEPDPVVAHPVVACNKIVDNVASNGAGIAIEGDLVTNLVPAPPSSPHIVENIIARNEAFQNGGGIGCWGHTAPLIENNFIMANSATTFEIGWDSDDPIGPFFLGGGGIFATKRDMGGVPVEYAISAPSIVNNVVAANGALLGGGICLALYPRLSEPDNPPQIVTNNTIVANNGSGIYAGDTFPLIRNNLVAFNTWGLQLDQSAAPVIAFNNVYGNAVQGEKTNYLGSFDQTGINGNISANPEMANFQIGEFHLQPGSPCIDAGSVDAVLAEWKDIDGQDRIMGAGVDIGADEADGISRSASIPVIRVSTSGDDAQNGLAWATAMRTVSAGIQRAAETGGEVWVAAGTYEEHIEIPPFVYLYGGFFGMETMRESRDVSANATIIDGGGIPTVVSSRNAGYLVSALDGFTIQNGGVYRGNVIPDVSWGVEGRGGGIRSVATGLYIRNNIIRRNSFGNPFDNAGRRGAGAGIHGYVSHSVIGGNTICDNEILNTYDGQGAGLYFKYSMPSIEDNTIIQNHAAYGSAIYCILSIPRIRRNLVEENALYVLGVLYRGSVEGAINIDMCEDFLIEANMIGNNTALTGAGICAKTNLAGRIQNNCIIDNVAGEPSAGGGFSFGMGGGIYCVLRSDAGDYHRILNNTIMGNTATTDFGAFVQEQGGGLAVSLPLPLPPPQSVPPGMLIIGNNIIAFNSSGIFQTLTDPLVVPTLVKNDLFNGDYDYMVLSPGTSDIGEDPEFIDRIGGDCRLEMDSQSPTSIREFQGFRLRVGVFRGPRCIAMCTRPPPRRVPGGSDF